LVPIDHREAGVVVSVVVVVVVDDDDDACGVFDADAAGSRNCHDAAGLARSGQTDAV
jgi:hypothetical protein